MADDSTKSGKKVAIAGDVTIPLEYYLPEDIVAQYSDGIVVTSTQEAFFLSFTQVEIPLIPTKAGLENLKSVRARCVSRVILSPVNLERFVNILSAQLAEFKGTQGK